MCYTACVIFGMWLIWSTCFCWSEKDRLSIWHIRIIDQNKNKLQFNYYKYQRCKVCMDLNWLDICWPYVECSMISSEVFPIGRCLSFPPGVLPLRVWYSGMWVTACHVNPPVSVVTGYEGICQRCYYELDYKTMNCLSSLFVEAHNYLGYL